MENATQTFEKVLLEEELIVLNGPEDDDEDFDNDEFDLEEIELDSFDEDFDGDDL